MNTESTTEELFARDLSREIDIKILGGDPDNHDYHYHDRHEMEMISIKYLLKLRQQTIEECVEVLESGIELKYPSNRWVNSKTGVMTRGVQEKTYVRMLKEEDFNTLVFANHLIKNIKEMK